jgi:hypothetical protein
VSAAFGVVVKAFAISLLFIGVAVAANLWVFPPYPRTNWYELPVPTIGIAAICACLVTAFITIKGNYPCDSPTRYLAAMGISLIVLCFVFFVSLVVILNIKGS